MSKAKELFDQWLDLKDETNRMLVKAIVESHSGNPDMNKLDNWLNNVNFQLENFIKKSREIFEHDERRLNERNDTIKYLQDKLAARKK